MLVYDSVKKVEFSDSRSESDPRFSCICYGFVSTYTDLGMTRQSMKI